MLIETILAAFEMDEILYELQDHIVGLNCGRWDYIFSFIKKFSRRPDFVLPDRQQVTMTTHFLRSYSQLLIKTCHRRGAFAMGGMAAQIPIKNDPKANDEALGQGARRQGARGGRRSRRHLGRASRPRADRDGSLRPADADAESAAQDAAQTSRSTRADLLQIPQGTITEAGLRNNVSVAHSVPRRVARRARLRADQQPDGRRRHRRDLARADLAVDQASRAASSTTAARSRPSCSARSCARSWTSSPRQSASRPTRRATTSAPPTLIDQHHDRAGLRNVHHACRRTSEIN